jgi:hypothetical protein
MGGGFSVEVASIDDSAHLLIEIAGLLYAGRLDGDYGTMARAPRAHPDVGVRVQEFASFADDQYQDLVLLLTALSTKLTATGRGYVEVDQRVRAELDQFLATGQYIPSQGR